jgi:glycosyltransferase involved in cell wall biosynthesis
MKKILFIRAHNTDLEAKLFRRRYDCMAGVLESHVLVTGDLNCDNKEFSNTTLHVVERKDNIGFLGKIGLLCRLVKKGCSVAKKRNIDVVVSYDPLFLGMVGLFVSLISRCRLVIEINGHFKSGEAKSLAGSGLNPFNKYVYNICCWLTLSFASAVKLLNNKQYDEWEFILKYKPCYMFHDFVLTSEFKTDMTKGKYILCVGFPFYLKGIDLLLESFQLLNSDFPDVSLKVIGYCPVNELEKWQKLFDSVPKADLLRPIPHKEIVPYMQECLFFVLPSRSEAMGRVLIEAMACGKAVIGSKIGGIPEIISHGENGLLFDQGIESSVDDLTEAMRTLLSDNLKRLTMGEKGRYLAANVFSESRYVYSYNYMLEKVSNISNDQGTGIIYSSYRTHKK